MGLLRRGIEPTIGRLLDSAKVVVIEGGRSVGKTTLARRIATERAFETVFDLSDPADLAALEADAFRVLDASPGPVLIDEAQLIPDLTVAVKRLVDQSGRFGQVLLTGSSRIGRGALGGGDPLAGRAVRARLTSFTRSELAGTPSSTLADWWTGDPTLEPREAIDLLDLTEALVAGGLPPIALNPAAGTALRGALIEAYVEGVLTMNLAGSRVDRSRLAQTFRYLAANPGQILNISRAASELSMSADTFQRYLELCTTAFLLESVPAVRPNEHQSVTAHPRVFTSDVALAAWAADTSPERLVRQRALSRSLLENLVAHELLAQSAWSVAPARLMHWRDTRAGHEVDLVLRDGPGSYLAFEVKSASTVSISDARGLRAFAEAAGERLIRSFVVHTGRLVTQLDEHIWAVPVTALFEGGR
ncbi:MAG: DUF4143 domain-containing protein [Candidatus Microthrix parvicella]